MQLGTAKITSRPPKFTAAPATRLFIVEWMNHGSFLRNEPRAFLTEQEAISFCRERSLHVVRS